MKLRSAMLLIASNSEPSPGYRNGLSLLGTKVIRVNIPGNGALKVSVLVIDK